jgi:Dolichyl-phosphate-mannose-protein mannosyltransferase
MAFIGYSNSAPPLNEALDRAARKFESLAASNKFVGSVFILLLVYMMYSSTRGISIYDEGLICYGADRVLAGDVPYRDFWTAYGPGQYYLLAGVFKVFGTSLLVARMYCVFVEWIVAILAYSISRRITGPVGGVISCVSVAVWLSYDRTVLYPVIPAFAFALAGFWSLAHSSSKKNIILAGLLTGCVTVVRYDLGIYAFAIQSVIVVRQSLVGPINGAAEKPLFRAGELKGFLIYATSASGVVLPVFLALTRAVPRQMLYEIFVDFPFRIYPQFRSVPFPRPQDFVTMGMHGLRATIWSDYSIIMHGSIYGLPLLVLTGSAVLLLGRWMRSRLLNAENWLAAALVSFGFGVFFSIRVRPDLPHMVLAMVSALILLPWLVRLINASTSIRSLYRPFSNLLLICLGLVMLHCITKRHIQPWLNDDAARFLPINIDRAKGISIVSDTGTDGFAEAVQYIREKTPAGESIYVGNTRHDQIYYNNAMFYFLAERRSATRFVDLQPGIATIYRGQSEIIEAIKRQKVSYVVLWEAPLSPEPNRSSESSGVTTLDDFIKANYERVAGFGKYVILRSFGRGTFVGRVQWQGVERNALGFRYHLKAWQRCKNINSQILRCRPFRKEPFRC